MPNGKYRDEYRTDVKPSSPKLEYRTTVTPTESRRMGATVVPMVTRKMGAIVLPAKRRKVEPKKVVVEREPASESNTLTPNELLLSVRLFSLTICLSLEFFRCLIFRISFNYLYRILRYSILRFKRFTELFRPTLMIDDTN